MNNKLQASESQRAALALKVREIIAGFTQKPIGEITLDCVLSDICPHDTSFSLHRLALRVEQGFGGGFILMKFPPEVIAVADVIELVERKVNQ